MLLYNHWSIISTYKQGWDQKVINFILSDVYGHSVVLLTCLLFIAIFTRFDQADYFEWTMYLFVLWFFLEFYFVLRSDHYWMETLHLMLASMVMYAIYIGLGLICEKYGTMARGDGAGWAYIIPPYLFLFIFIFSLMLKAIAVMWSFLFGSP